MNIRLMKNTLLKTVVALALFVTVSVSTAEAARPQQDPTCTQLIPYVQPGDVLFTAVEAFVFREVAELTKSWTSHVGIIFQQNGRWVVYESRVPKSSITPLCEFVARSTNGQVALKRFNQSLNAQQISILQQAASERLGYFYHQGFDYDNNKRFFCSKYVYDVYQQIGVNMGKIESFKQLFENNPNADVEFWTKWYLGNIPWTRRTVTPASQLNDPNWITIFSNNVE